MLFLRAALAVCASALALSSCGGGAQRSPGPLRIVATTSTLASLARGVTGSDVRSLVPVGAAAEDYQPSPRDIAALHDADVLVENGAGLEGWLAATVRNASNPALRIVVASDGLSVKEHNPHLWMDPVFAQAYVAKIRDAAIAADPPRAETYRTNAAAYDRALAALAARTAQAIATVPASRRVMIVTHDAFLYYAARFGLRIAGAIEIAPGAEPNPRHISELARIARNEHVPAVFAEFGGNDRLAHALAASVGGLKVATLYDDSVGTGGPASSYIGMIDADTATIVGALK